MLNEPHLEQSMNKTVATIVPSSKQILILMTFSCDNDLTCSATPADAGAFDAIVATVAENNEQGGSENTYNLQDKPRK